MAEDKQILWRKLIAVILFERNEAAKYPVGLKWDISLKKQFSRWWSENDSSGELRRTLAAACTRFKLTCASVKSNPVSH